MRRSTAAAAVAKDTGPRRRPRDVGPDRSTTYICSINLRRGSDRGTARRRGDRASEMNGEPISANNRAAGGWRPETGRICTPRHKSRHLRHLACPDQAVRFGEASVSHAKTGISPSITGLKRLYTSSYDRFRRLRACALDTFNAQRRSRPISIELTRRNHSCLVQPTNSEDWIPAMNRIEAKVRTARRRLDSWPIRPSSLCHPVCRTDRGDVGDRIAGTASDEHRF